MDSLAELGTLVEEQLALEQKITEAELALSKLKDEYRVISQEKIPSLLHSTGLSEVKLKDGKKLQVKHFVSCNITDMQAFVAFLEKNGDDSLVHTTFDLGKVDKANVDELFKYAYELGISAEMSQKIHPQTLNRYIKEICGVESGKGRVSLEAVQDFVHTYTYDKTVISK